MLKGIHRGRGVVSFFLFGTFFSADAVHHHVVSRWAGAIFLGGAGSVHYRWHFTGRKARPRRAWASLLTGSTLAVSGILAQQFLPEKHFPLNGTQVSFFCLPDLDRHLHRGFPSNLPRGTSDMDRMLHRGKYAVIKKLTGRGNEGIQNPQPAPARDWHRQGIFRSEINSSPPGLFCWMLIWFVRFSLSAPSGNLISPWVGFPSWRTYWHFTAIGIPITITVRDHGFGLPGVALVDIYRLFSPPKAREKPMFLITAPSSAIATRRTWFLKKKSTERDRELSKISRLRCSRLSRPRLHLCEVVLRVRIIGALTRRASWNCAIASSN